MDFFAVISRCWDEINRRWGEIDENVALAEDEDRCGYEPKERDDKDAEEERGAESAARKTSGC